ncbi:MAG: type I restriction endonuclease subunit R [Patescibacteria group bacterium]
MPTTYQSEAELEQNLIDQLKGLGYTYVKLTNEADVLKNLKNQLEKHNQTTFTDNEFAKILNHLNKGGIFDRAKILRDKMQLTKDDGTSIYLEFINIVEWCQNEYQVTNQVTVEGKYTNRYDVTLLVNGLPLVQIELKRRGLELKEAFNQIIRYQQHSFGYNYGLYNYVQFFVISNGVNTKYYANSFKFDFKQTFYWSDKENQLITQLKEFTQEFLEPCHMSKMITRYTVLNETRKCLMILRPYQYYATEAIIDRVKNSTKNGYIWHTTGSGKTLTSFKTSQILTKMPQVHKVVFVVDRKDLDYQTSKEFNSFSNGSVDGTTNTNNLVKQFADDTPLIVTTIQKLNTAISKQHHATKMEDLKDKKIVFIFDECHRSQFGETHNRIKEYFNNAQMFGFTGTPIFADNAVKNSLGKRTTTELFEECLHKYVITDAIKDDNVLKFSIEYVGKYKQKEGANNIDIKVEDIDTAELMDSEDRLEKIVDYILANHDRKTHNKEFTSIFCVSSVPSLIKYYEIFKRKNRDDLEHLNIATIFSFAANEEALDDSGDIPDVELEVKDELPVHSFSRDKLEEFIADYNHTFGTNFSTRDSQSFYNYYNDIAKKVKAKQVDILLVVNMFLTGFDSPDLNTLYVDKNLQYHGLIQAFSRTNRVNGEKKSHGNIVCFRNLKKATDDAIALFSNKNAKDVILMEPFEVYLKKFNDALKTLQEAAPTVDSVNQLYGEEQELKFIKAFRNLIRLKNVLSGFADFSFDQVEISSQEFQDYQSKYVDLYEKHKPESGKEKVSIINDVDFELELIHRDEITVTYILQLLANLKDASKEEQEVQRKAILNLLASEVQLRSKKELIERFITENLPLIQNSEDIPPAFEAFIDAEKLKAFEEICEEEKLEPERYRQHCVQLMTLRSVNREK